jgi:hypothetical protein
MREMLDDRFDDLLRDSARDYNEPPETPRDVMWERIAAQRAEKNAAETAEAAEQKHAGIHPFRPYRLLRRFSVRLVAGIAAILALGFGLGRLTKRPVPAVPPTAIVAAPTREPRPSETAYRVATTEHLSQSEAFLTLFRASLRRGGSEQLASATARQLLATNRLLLDSPAASDRRTRLLLQDLELVLAEIAQLSHQPRSHDLDLIEEGLDQGGVLSRLRTAVPPGASTTQGAL